MTSQSARERPSTGISPSALRQQMIDEFESGGFAGAAASEEDEGFATIGLRDSSCGEVRSRCSGDRRRCGIGWRGGGREDWSFISLASGAETKCEGKMLSRQPAGRRRYRDPPALLLVRLCRQAGDANSGVAFVSDVEADQERGDLLEMRAFSSLPPSMARTPGILAARVAHFLSGIGIVAADDHVAVDWRIRIQQFSGDVVKCGDHRDSFGNEFGGLLRGRTLPDAESASGASADAGGERDGGIDHDAAGANRGLELFEQSGLAFERDGENQQVGGGAGGGVFVARNFGVGADCCFDLRGRILGAFGVARSDDDGFAGASPAQARPKPSGRCRRERWRPLFSDAFYRADSASHSAL